MTTQFKRIIIAAIVLIALAGVACGAVLCSSGAPGPVEDARVGVLNTAIDVSGIKGRIDAEVRAKATEVAGEYGISQTAVDNIMDSVAIEDWQATALPPDAVETGTYTVASDDVTAKVTTYDDPRIVTVEAYGQTVTMEVPESAQGYIPFIRYLEYLGDE